MTDQQDFFLSLLSLSSSETNKKKKTQIILSDKQFKQKPFPIVAVTAQVLPEVVSQAQTAGFDGFMGKPLNFDRFPKLIRTLLSGEKVWGLSGFEWNTPISIAAWTMGLAQIPFIINFFWSMKRGEKVDINPWHATTLEWVAPTPPGHGNFGEELPTVYRWPFDYSVPGEKEDFIPQTVPATVIAKQ